MSNRELTVEDLRDLVFGSNFFGGGGGGCREEGDALIQIMIDDPEIDFPLSLIPLDEMAVTEGGREVVSVMVAALGSPTATKGKTFIEEATCAVEGMIEEAANEGRFLKYIYSGEQGGGNTMLPIYVAAKKGMGILDLDGNGRAVPEMGTGLQPVYEVPTSPVVLGSGAGDIIIGKTVNPLDCDACEQLARQMCQVYDQGIGFSAWLMTKTQHENSAIGQITMSVEAGRIFRNTPADQIVHALSDYFQGKRNFHCICASGQITSIAMDVGGGFDRGFTTIEGDDHNIYKVLFQNENLVAYKGDEAVATVPGIISLIDIGNSENIGIPLSNTETCVGQKVALVYTDAAPSWYGRKEGYGCWTEVLNSAGYCKTGPMLRPGK